MKNYLTEFLFIILVIVLSIGGFWNIFFDVDADPDYYQSLHALIVFLWLFLLLGQLLIFKKKKITLHRQLGTAVFVMCPLVFAHLALLSIHSANNSAIAGRVDDFLVQNVFFTVEVGLIILLGFFFRKNIKLHANFLISSALLFMGIALFFVLISFIPQFKIEGPETFYRFGTQLLQVPLSVQLWDCTSFLRIEETGGHGFLLFPFFSLMCCSIL